jgi:tetratricopeptide (TPR) repeat protein
MANPDSEERIRDLEQRMAAMPGSRIFVGLAEEYRRAGRYEDALNTLQKGLAAHPTYLSAQIALARLYKETWRTQEAIEAFSIVLAMDRENLVAAKALSELYENSRNPVEAIKKLKLYRAISGDRSIDEKIGKMESEIGAAKAPLPPPAASVEELSLSPDPRAIPEPDPKETVSIALSHYAAPAAPLSAPQPETPQASSRIPSVLTPVPSPQVVAAFEMQGERGRGGVSRGEDAEPSPIAAAPAVAEPESEIPPSRTLADRYYKQGFLADARKIYEKLAVSNPMDESVTRRLGVLRKPSRRKAAKLKLWLARIQANAKAGRA